HGDPRGHPCPPHGGERLPCARHRAAVRGAGGGPARQGRACPGNPPGVRPRPRSGALPRHRPGARAGDGGGPGPGARRGVSAARRRALHRDGGPVSAEPTDVTLAPADLRSFLRELEAAEPNALITVEREVDPAYELSAVVKALEPYGAPAVRFERVKGSGMPVISGLYGTRRRIALALGTRVEQAVDFA